MPENADNADFIAMMLRHSKPGITPTPVPGLTLYRSDTATTPLAVVYEPMLCVVVQGRKRVVVGDTVCHYDPKHSLIVTLDLPVLGSVCDVTCDAPYLAISVRLDRNELASLLLQLPTGAPAAARPAQAGLDVAPMAPALLETCLRLTRLLETPEDIEILAPLIRRELLYRLLTGPHASTLRALARGDGVLGQVQQAIAWVRQHYDQPLRIDALARRVALSTSSLHRHFKAATRLSPLQYHKQVRLQAARERLMAEPVDAAAVAYAVGYESASQFNREFKRLFGHPPAEAARRWREQAPAVP